VVNGTALLLYPLYAGLIVLGGDFIEIFFGDKWQNSLVPMQILLLAGFIGPLFLYSGIAMVAMGRNRLVLFVNAFEFAISAICAVIMARQGLEWAAASSVVRLLIFVPFSWWFAKKELDLPYLGTVVACWRPAVAASLLVLAVVGSQYLAAPFTPKITTAILAGLTGAAVYCVAIWFLEFENLIFILERSPASRVLKTPFLQCIIHFTRRSSTNRLRFRRARTCFTFGRKRL
jgi:teichuronic acid exporter